MSESSPSMQAVDPTRDVILRAPKRWVRATYHSHKLEITEYADNNFILALPPFINARGIFQAIDTSYVKAAPPNSRRWSREKRVMGLGLIRSTVVGTSYTLPIIDTIYGGLRHRYLDCDPKKNKMELAQLSYKLVQEGVPAVILEDSEAHAGCFSVFGVSGMGKSTLVKAVLSTLPPAILHEEPWRFMQVVYVFVVCPHNGSIKMLMEAILEWFDHNIDTKYLEEIGKRATEPQLIRKVVLVLKKHETGLLVIDDIEFLLRTNASKDTLDFITSLLSENCCMVLVISTPEIKPKIRDQLRRGRRYLSEGAIEMDPFDVDDPDAEKVTDGIMRLDFLPSPPTDIETVRQALIRFAGGVTALMKEAWRLTQYGAICRGDRCIAPEMIDAYSRPTFSSIDGLLTDLQTKNWGHLRGVPDALSSAVDRRIQLEEKSRYANTMYQEYKAVDAQNAFLDAVEALTRVGIPQIKAEDRVRRILITEPDLEAAYLVQRALTETLLSETSQKDPSSGEARAPKTKKAREKKSTAAHTQTDSWEFDPNEFLDPSSARDQ